jgi:apolipoprotein N-acyltransferase
VGLAFAAAEWIRATVFGGLPWLLLAYALTPVPALLALAPWGGVPLLSAWLGAIATALLRLDRSGTRSGAAVALALLAALGLAAAIVAPELGVSGASDTTLPQGAVRPLTAKAHAPRAVRIGLVQPALPMDRWADPLHAASTVEALTNLSAEAAERVRFDLVVWPENAVQALLPANEALVRRAVSALDGRIPLLLLGAPRYDPAAPTRRFNAALLYRTLEPERAVLLATHDKGKLLPWFESTPSWRWLASWVPKGAGLVAGDGPTVLRVSDHLGIGPLICYEVLFPGIARQLVRDGAGVLVNLSNDAWFGGSGGAEQHFAASILLAATHRRPLLRSTPTGVTAAIDAAGRVVSRLPPDEPGVLAVEVMPATSQPPAVVFGDAPAWFALLFASAWTLLESRRGLRGTPRSS